jgi:hypothetical protein
MRVEINHSDWGAALREVNTHNFQRATRLEVIGEIGDVARDYWMENGVPFLGLSLEEAVADGPRFEVMLGKPAAGSGHLTHVVPQVSSLVVERNYEGQTDALELRDSQGNTTILRFETHCARAFAA